MLNKTIELNKNLLTPIKLEVVVYSNPYTIRIYEENNNKITMIYLVN